MYEFFVPMLFWQLFSSYMYIVNAAETTFVQKNCMFNFDEIDASALNKAWVIDPLPQNLKENK